MKRHITGLSQQSQNGEGQLEGLFLVRVERASYRWHPQKSFFTLYFVILEPKEFRSEAFFGKALWHSESLVEAELVPARLRL